MRKNEITITLSLADVMELQAALSKAIFEMAEKRCESSFTAIATLSLYSIELSHQIIKNKTVSN